jgi:hypothetical protein
MDKYCFIILVLKPPRSGYNGVTWTATISDSLNPN